MQINLRVDWGNGSHEVSTKPSTIIALERKFKVRATGLASEGVGYEHLAFLAHEALRSGGTIVPPFNEFCDKLEVLEVVDGDDTAPFPGAASAGS